MTDFELMGAALDEARKAAALGEVPVGAVVAKDVQPGTDHRVSFRRLLNRHSTRTERRRGTRRGCPGTTGQRSTAPPRTPCLP